MGWGEFFALSSALAWACAVILLRRSGRTLPALELNLFKNSLSLLLLSLTILALSGTARLGEVTVRRLLESALDLVVQLDRAGSRRRVREIAEVAGGEVREVWCSPT